MNFSFRVLKIQKSRLYYVSILIPNFSNSDEDMAFFSVNFFFSYEDGFHYNFDSVFFSDTGYKSLSDFSLHYFNSSYLDIDGCLSFSAFDYANLRNVYINSDTSNFDNIYTLNYDDFYLKGIYISVSYTHTNILSRLSEN